VVSAAVSRAELRKQRAEALAAFNAARAGDRTVPIELVKAGLNAQLAALFALARRRLQAATGLTPRFGTVKSDDVLAAAERIAARCAANVALEQRDTVEDAIRTAAFFGLNLVYLGADVRAQSRKLRTALRALAATNVASPDLPVRRAVRAFSRCADTLADVRDVVTLDQRANPIFRKIDAAPAEEFRALFELWPELSSSVARIWKRVTNAFSLPSLSSEERETFETLLLTSLVLFCADGSGSGDGEAFRAFVRATSSSFERGMDRVLALTEIALAVRRLLPERETAPA
jgi:hypothetical protein